MGHACWHVQDCHLLAAARMGLVEALHPAIVGSCVVTSVSEMVGGSLWGGLLCAKVLMLSNPWVPEMSPDIQRILSRPLMLCVSLLDGLPAKDA